MGGSVLDGYSIVSAILSSKVPVDTYVDGLAASIAGVIAVAGRNVYISDYGTLMLHNPAGGNDEAVLKLVKDTLVTILSNRSKKTPEQISEMMDKETWLGAKDALQHGFVTEVLSSGKKVKIKQVNSLPAMALVYNKLLNPTNMSKLNTLLKISNNADEAEQEAAIVAINKALADKENELTEAKNRLKVIEDKQAADELKAKEALKNKVTEFANTLEKEGKIKADEKAGLIENASASEAQFSFVQNLYSKVPSKNQSQKPFTGVQNSGKTEDRAAWTYGDWEKKDAKGLTNMYVNDRAAYDELLNQHINK